jgi:hypothetical protein
LGTPLTRVVMSNGNGPGGLNAEAANLVGGFLPARVFGGDLPEAGNLRATANLVPKEKALPMFRC